MRSLLIVAAILLLMTGGAYAIAPLVAPIPPGVVGPAECAVAAGSVSGTKIHSDISDDIGIIVDNANTIAYKSWWVHNPYVTTAVPIISGALGDTAEAMQDASNNGVGFTGWITAKWDMIKAFLAEHLSDYPALEQSIGQYYTEGVLPPVAVGETYHSSNGGYYTATTGITESIGNLDYSAENWIPCSMGPTPDDETYMKINTYYPVYGFGPAIDLAPGMPNGTTMYVRCFKYHNVPGYRRVTGAQTFRYNTSWTGDTIDRDNPPPGVWNPAVDAAINDPAIAGNPDVKTDMCKVLNDAPDVLDPVLDKLTASNLAQAVSAQGTELLADNIASLAQQVAADPTNVQAQQALNDALAAQAAQAAQEMEKQAVIAADMPELAAVEKSVIDWTPLSNLIGASCSKIDKNDCPFPFDFIYSLGNTFDQFQSEHPTMVDPSGSYGFDNFKINFNFDLSRFTETMAKIRLVLSWLMTIYTIHKCVRIVMRDNSAGDDD